MQTSREVFRGLKILVGKEDEPLHNVKGGTVDVTVGEVLDLIDKMGTVHTLKQSLIKHGVEPGMNINNILSGYYEGYLWLEERKKTLGF